MFPKIGENPQYGWFIMENPIKMGWFGGTTIFWKHPITVQLKVFHLFFSSPCVQTIKLLVQGCPILPSET